MAWKALLVGEDPPDRHGRTQRARVGALVGRDVPDGDQRERCCCGQPDRRASNMTLLHVISLLASNAGRPRWPPRLGRNVPRPTSFGPSDIVEKSQRARVRVNAQVPSGFINSDEGDRPRSASSLREVDLLTANRRTPRVNPTTHRPDLARTGRHVRRRVARRHQHAHPTSERVPSPGHERSSPGCDRATNTARGILGRGYRHACRGRLTRVRPALRSSGSAEAVYRPRRRFPMLYSI